MMFLLSTDIWGWVRGRNGVGNSGKPGPVPARDSLIGAPAGALTEEPIS